MAKLIRIFQNQKMAQKNVVFSAVPNSYSILCISAETCAFQSVFKEHVSNAKHERLSGYQVLRFAAVKWQGS
jgi:hypothetical protein